MVAVSKLMLEDWKALRKGTADLENEHRLRNVVFLEREEGFPEAL